MRLIGAALRAGYNFGAEGLVGDWGEEYAAPVIAAPVIAAPVIAPSNRTPWPQRSFDLVLTILALPVTALMAAAIAIAIYLDSPGPVLFRSQRVGRGGTQFEMLKFRKMRRDAPSHPVTLDDDERFTPIGRFLAATRLDELPQFVNVLRGEMRLVGPRPELEYFVTRYPEQYAEILTVTPGITGNAQIRFLDERWLLRGPDPANTYREHVLPAKIEIDVEYARSHSLARDVILLLHTLALPAAVLSSRAYESGAVRRWGPAIAAAMALAMLFVLFSSQLA